MITGPSGSGKSSLAFDTIYAEGQRRYVESLSAYARQFLERMEKPSVDAVRVEIQSPKPGWKADIYGANGSHAPESIDAGWTKLAGGTVRSDHQRFKLDTGGKRYAKAPIDEGA